MAAEIGWSGATSGRDAVAASMRPRRMAAEIARLPERIAWNRLASMRPRRMAAEIGPRATTPMARSTRFNEAAANGRGNLAPLAAFSPRRPALQ